MSVYEIEKLASGYTLTEHPPALNKAHAFTSFPELVAFLAESFGEGEPAGDFGYCPVHNTALASHYWCAECLQCYAPDPSPPAECDGTMCSTYWPDAHCEPEPYCQASGPYLPLQDRTAVCTLPLCHHGDHIECSYADNKHNLARWPQEEKP